MKQYEYKFVGVKAKRGLKDKRGDTFWECEQIITAEAQNGWRLKQVVTSFDEKMGVYCASGYQIIFEREIEITNKQTI